MIKGLRSSIFARNVAILASGSFLAQAITIVASPILTRYYSPESFAVIALFMALASPILPALCGRYDMATVLAASRREGIQLLGLALSVSALFSLILLLLILAFHQSIVKFFNASILGTWLFLGPVFLFSSSIVTALRCFTNLNDNYSVISKITILQALITTVVSVALGFLGVDANGLLIGNFMGVFITCACLLCYYKKLFKTLAQFRVKELFVVAKKYKDFPIFSATTSFLDGLAVALPVIFLAKYYPDNIVGYYALLVRVAQAPLSFVSNAVSQVLMKKTSELLYASANLTMYIRKVAVGLAGVVVLPALILMIWGPDLFASIFGESWRMAGDLSGILMPAFALRFVVSTISGTLAATGHVKLGSVWQLIFLAGTFTMFTILAPRLSINDLFFAMLLTDLLLYLLYASFIWYSVKNPVVRV
jgi:O-antigen/teichoic acid export membrane protein